MVDLSESVPFDCTVVYIRVGIAVSHVNLYMLELELSSLPNKYSSDIRFFTWKLNWYIYHKNYSMWLFKKSRTHRRAVCHFIRVFTFKQHILKTKMDKECIGEYHAEAWKIYLAISLCGWVWCTRDSTPFFFNIMIRISLAFEKKKHLFQNRESKL